MIKLFQRRRKAAGAAEPPPEKKSGKRTYVRLLEFRCRGRLLNSVKTDSLGSVVRIGRAADNDWVVPPQDRVCADYQAELRLGSREMRLQACSGQSIHYRGKAVSSCVLKGNDRVAIGDCELFVKPAELHEARPCDVHRLEFLNGPRAGELLRLEKALIRIGSDPENDIVIAEDVVSRFHAEIRIAENEESWIRDLNSLNGTFVNGSKLGRQERMLMDSDEISVAFTDLRFLDRNVPHTRSQIGRKILIMGGTVLVILAFFGLFYAMTPQAGQVLNAAEYYIRRADFAAARRMLDRMPESRDYQKYEKYHLEHLKNIARYEKTLASWKEFQRHLNDSDWEDAAECFGRLEIDNRFAWNWEDATVDERMAVVRHAKALLDLQFKLRSLLSSMDSEPSLQVKVLAEVKQNPLLAVGPQKEAEWLQPLRKEIGRLVAELENNCAIWAKMQAALKQLGEESTDFKALVAAMKQFGSASSGSVRVRAQDLAELLGRLERNQNMVAANQAALGAMQFDKIQREIAFVSQDDCMISSQAMEKRNQLVERQEALLRNAEDMKYLLSKLKNVGLQPGKIPAIVEQFGSAEMVEKALRLDCLKGKMPNARRKTPVDAYDRMFGIRFFYDVIQQSSVLPTNMYSGDIISSLDFYPDCIALAALYRAVEETALWLSLPENQWMIRDGEAKKLKQYCDALLKRRADMLAMFNRMAEAAPGTRNYFIAKAAFFYFSPASTVPREEMQRYAAAWKKFRKVQQDRLAGYDPLKPQAAARIGAEILADGIPGDPVFNWIWSQKNE